jgi:hypothetical protein
MPVDWLPSETSPARRPTYKKVEGKVRILSYAVWGLLLIPMLGLAKDAQLGPQLQAATAHRQHSYVLVLGDQVINRGRFEDRAAAVKFRKSLHIKDYVWYSTPAGCFVLSDTGKMASLKEAELPWKEIAKRWETRGLTREDTNDLRAEQDRLIRQRDEAVWGLYDDQQTQGRMSAMKVECPVPR